MGRNRVLRRGKVFPILAAAVAGYLIGSWNAAAVRSPDRDAAPTAAEAVALRFPSGLGDAPVVLAASYERATASGTATSGSRGTPLADAQLALFAPEPMISPRTDPEAAGQSIPADTTELPLEPARTQPGELPTAKAGAARAVARLPAAARSPAHSADRPGFLLDDAQIASIKRRLQLTPDQERMWPAVAAALRNLANAREREARRTGTPGSVDPNSAEAQDFKSAAIPLLMSFSDEQRDEVRSLAHVMGLDQLASQF